MRWMVRPLSIAKIVMCACGWSSVLLAGACHAQEAQAAGAQAAGAQATAPVFTLKVYTNLVQIPTLVLDHERQPLPRIDYRRFQLSLDGGKLFAPTNVRMEGDDPLDIAILLDVTGSQKHLINGFAEAAGQLAANSLHPQDHVSIYALGCNLVRSAKGMPVASEPVRAAVENALETPTLNKSSDLPTPCGKNVYLWGAVTQLIKEMNDATGRRVILLVSAGVDNGTAITWQDLHQFAAANGVAIFGLNDGWSPPAVLGRHAPENPLTALCESTGGIVLETWRNDLNKPLQRWIGLLRGRYVVEFPRPQGLGLATGAHDIEVSIKRDGLAFTTLAGVSVTLPDPKITSDPNYVPSQQGSDIPVGNRRSQH